MQKTISNNRVLSSALVAILRTLTTAKLFKKERTYVASIKQKKKGPHKSQFLISLRFYSVSTFASGFITILNFCQILYKSRFYEQHRWFECKYSGAYNSFTDWLVKSVKCFLHCASI